MLSKIADTCFLCFSDVSYIAYADDILLISRSKFSLSKMVDNVRKGFLDMELNLNIEKCEYLCYNGNATKSPLNWNYASIRSVDSLRWLGITLCNNMFCFRQSAVRDACTKIRCGYSKIVANRSKYNRKALVSLYSVFCDHAISGIYILLRKNDLSKLRKGYYRYCKFLLYLPL